MSENFTPVKTEAAQSGEDTENSKSKKKKKAIGAFVVEADPSDTTKSFWRPPKSTSREAKPPLLNPELNTEADTLSEVEKTEAIKQLAAARKLELTNPDSESTDSPEETEAALAYLAAVEANGDIEAIDSILTAESEEPLTAEQPHFENVIDTDQPSEGEISLDNEPTPDQIPREADTGNGGGNQPPWNPNFIQAESSQPEEPDRPFTPPAVPVGNLVPLNVAIQNERRAQTDGLIVGAIVGYFVGRRRGRIKTEKKLLPVQKKLEKQVKLLQSELITREFQVRQKVREGVVSRPAEKPTINIEKQPRSKSAIGSTERIGHVLVAASSNVEKISAPKANKRPTLELAVAKKRAESMDRSELLAVSQNIVVEGTSIRQIYETQLISEKGLRRLVTEHLRGGNISRALKRELVERQIDFERDPLLRDKSYKNGADNAGKAALASMLSRAGIAESSPDEIIQSKKQKESAKNKSIQRSGPQSLIDTSLAALIGFLILIILTLLFRG